MAAVLIVAFKIGPIWAAIIALCIGVVLALEMVNAALEYLIDHVHPEIAKEIKHAKDASAGAVLLASGATIIVGGFAALSWLDLL